MWNLDRLAKEVANECRAFCFVHNISERNFLAGGNTNFLSNCRRSDPPDFQIGTLGRLRDRMTALDIKWKLQSDRRDSIVALAQIAEKNPTAYNVEKLWKAVRFLNCWPEGK